MGKKLRHSQVAVCFIGSCPPPTWFYLSNAEAYSCLQVWVINDLAEEIKASNVGLDLDSETFINILLYADDIVLLAKSEHDLQSLLFLVENWWQNWRLEVNLTKTNIMHVRSNRKQQSKGTSN